MARILVAYASMAGSTAEVAERIAQTLETDDVTAESHPISAVLALDAYDAVIITAPMILGWHRHAIRFLERCAEQLATMPVGYCITCYHFTDTGVEQVQGVPITIGPNLRAAPKAGKRLSFKERHSTPGAYLRGTFKRVPRVRPVDVGFFKGKIDYGHLSLFPMLFVKLLFGAESGDYRDWDAITAWAVDVRAKLLAAR